MLLPCKYILALTGGFIHWIECNRIPDPRGLQKGLSVEFMNEIAFYMVSSLSHPWAA
jgi:hypothetical protein